jgi:hypothetical protein
MTDAARCDACRLSVADGAALKMERHGEMFINVCTDYQACNRRWQWAEAQKEKHGAQAS